LLARSYLQRLLQTWYRYLQGWPDPLQVTRIIYFPNKDVSKLEAAAPSDKGIA
jgi:hypothetical protein